MRRHLLAALVASTTGSLVTGCYGDEIDWDGFVDPTDTGFDSSDTGTIPTDSGSTDTSHDATPSPDGGADTAEPDAGEPDSGAPTDDWPAELAAMELEVIELVNVERARGGVCGSDAFGPSGPVTLNTELRAAARGHATDMGERGYFDHVSPEGTEPWDRTAAAGYRGGGAQGENIAAGYATAAEVMAGWMDSPGHCSNILDASYNELGVGLAMVNGSDYTSYWVQNFGQR